MASSSMNTRVGFCFRTLRNVTWEILYSKLKWVVYLLSQSIKKIHIFLIGALLAFFSSIFEKQQFVQKLGTFLVFSSPELMIKNNV